MVSVTSVLSHSKKDFLEKWRKRVGEKVADAKTKRASATGTAFHECVESYLKNEEVTFSKPILRMLFTKLKPVLHRIDNIYAIEQSFFSTYLGVAGTTDIVAEFDGVLSVIDTKTSEKIKKEEWIESYFIQCCVYIYMIYELTGVVIKQVVIMMVSKDMEVEVFKKKFDIKYIKTFKKYLKNFRLDFEKEI
jgi:genome maintenance exonuclease 1